MFELMIEIIKIIKKYSINPPSANSFRKSTQTVFSAICT